jgi:hypothetical protein
VSNVSKKRTSMGLVICVLCVSVGEGGGGARGGEGRPKCHHIPWRPYTRTHFLCTKAGMLAMGHGTLAIPQASTCVTFEKTSFI